MISDTKPQNLIVVIMIVLGVVSGFGLATTANYYGGSYVIVSFLEVDLEEIRVTNVDIENVTINPRVALDFSFLAPEASSGEARLDYLTVSVYLNGDKFNYVTFRRDIPSDRKTLTSGYNETFTVQNTVTVINDKWLLYNATVNDEWVFAVTLTMFWRVFNARAPSVRIIAFSYEGDF